MSTNITIKNLLTALNSLIGNGTNLSNTANKFAQNNTATQDINQFGSLLHGLVNKSTASSNNNTVRNNNTDKDNNNFRTSRNSTADNTKVQRQTTEKTDTNNTTGTKVKAKDSSTNGQDDDKTVSSNKTSTESNEDTQKTETQTLTPEMIADLLRQLQQLLETTQKTQTDSGANTDQTEATTVEAATTTDTTEAQAGTSIDQLSQKVLDMLDKLKNMATDTQQAQVNPNQQNDIQLDKDLQKQISDLLEKIKTTMSQDDLTKPIKIEVEKNTTGNTEDLLSKIKWAVDLARPEDEKTEVKSVNVQPEQSDFAAAIATKSIAPEASSEDNHHSSTSKDNHESSPDLFAESLAASTLDNMKFDIAPVLGSNNNGIQNMEAVRNSIVNGIQNNHQQLNLQLEPANLGQLRVQISRQVQQGEAVISARLITNNIDAKDAIQNQISSLTQSLEAQGVKVGKIEVVDSGKHQQTVLNQMQQVFSNDSKVTESHQSQESTNNQNQQNNQDGFTQNFSQFQQAFQEQQSQQQVAREYEKLYASNLSNTETVDITQQHVSPEDLSLQNASISLKV